MTSRLLIALFVLGGCQAIAQDAGQGQHASTITLSVVEFQNRHPFLEEDWIASAAPDLIVATVMRAVRSPGGHLEVLDRSAIGALNAEAALAGDGTPARGAAATHVLGGTFIVVDGVLQIDVALTASGQPPSWSQHFAGPITALAVLSEHIAHGALASLNAPLGEASSGSGAWHQMPIAAMVTYQRGCAAVRRGDHAWALADFLRTCSTAPDFGESWLMLGTTLEALGRPAAAMAAWEQAIAVDPDDPAVPATLYRLARAHERQPDQSASRRLYQRLIDEYPFAVAAREFAEDSMVRDVTYAQLATQRLGLLTDSPAQSASAGESQAPVASGGSPLTAVGSRPAAGSASSALLAARLRQLEANTALNATNRSVNPWMEPLLNYAVFRAADGWPEQLPALRLRAGETLTLSGSFPTQVIAPVPGQLIERLTVSVVPKPGTQLATIGFTVVGEDTYRSSPSTQRILTSPTGGEVSAILGPEFAMGFMASISIDGNATRPAQAGAPVTDQTVRLTASLRPCRPGILWVETQPPGAFISLAGVLRGRSPCLIRDLAPGPVTLVADTMNERYHPQVVNPAAGYLRFRGELPVTVAPAGETRVRWTLAHQPDADAAAWSRASLVAAAPLLQPVPPPDTGNPSRAPSGLIHHPRLGWLSAWTVDQGIMLTISADGRSWAIPRPLHANSTVEESLEALAISPHGQILVVYARAHGLFAVTSDDATAWSAPSEIIAGGQRPAEVAAKAYGAISLSNRWLVACEKGGGPFDQVASSADGLNWKIEPTRLDPVTEWSIDDQHILLDAFADGTPALILSGSAKTNRGNLLLRFALDENHHWVIRDHSPVVEKLLWPVYSMGAVGNQVYEVSEPSGHGFRWQVGGAMLAANGLGAPPGGLTFGRSDQEAMLLMGVAGSWWCVHESTSTSLATGNSPEISYEHQSATPVATTTVSSTTPRQSTAALQAPDPHPAADPPLSTILDVQQPLISKPPAKKAHAANLIAALLLLLAGGVGVVFLVRRRLRRSHEVQPSDPVTRLVLLLGLLGMLAGGPSPAAELGMNELAGHLASPRSEERLAAFTGLAQIHNAAASAAAIAGARLHPFLQGAELEALAQAMGGQEIAKSVALLNAPEKSLLLAAIKDLGRRPAAELMPVMQTLLAQQEMEAIGQQILDEAMRHDERSPAHATLVMTQFQNPVESRRVAAVRALRTSGAVTPEAAAFIVKDMSPAVRTALIEVLGSMLVHDAAEIAANATWTQALLAELTADKVDSVRAAAYSALMEGVGHRYPRSISKQELELFLGAFADADFHVRAAAISYFCKSREEAAIPKLEHACADPEGVNASLALNALLNLGLPNLAQLAFQACSLPHPQDRWTAIQVLQQLNDPRLIQVATRLLDDQDTMVRGYAQAALRQGEAGTEKGGLEIVGMAKMKPDERQAMIVRMSQQDPAARLAELTKVFQDMTPEKRRDLLKQCGSDRQVAFSEGEFLLAHMLDADPQVASAAIDAVTAANGNNHHLGLAEALGRMSDPDRNVAQSARVCVLGSLQRVMGDNSMNFNLTKSISWWGKDEAKQLAEVMTDFELPKNSAPADRIRHFQKLALIDDDRALKVLRDAARSPDRSTRWAALEALMVRGDQSDATLDYGLARVLSAPLEDLKVRVVWPAMTPRLLVRLETFVGIAERDAIARVRADIERRLAALAELESVR